MLQCGSSCECIVVARHLRIDVMLLHHLDHRLYPLLLARVRCGRRARLLCVQHPHHLDSEVLRVCGLEEEECAEALSLRSIPLDPQMHELWQDAVDLLTGTS